MRIAVISDIHGNLPALEMVAAKVRNADIVVCLGDVVNYGPWNDECLELVASLPNVVLLEGNHEALFLGKEPFEHESPLVQLFSRTSLQWFCREDLIRDLPLELRRDDVLFTHTINGAKIYADTTLVPSEDSFVGHTHHAFDIRRGERRLVNPGSVGQNRARLDYACWAWWQPETGCVTLEYRSYPVNLLLQQMRVRGYPAECLAYYESKL